MKGWRHESNRHALAARGIKSRKYLYHGTSKNRLKEIKEKGLLTEHPERNYPCFGGEKYVYLTNDRDIAVSYAWNAAGGSGWGGPDSKDYRPVLLRIRRSELRKLGKVIPDPVNRKIIPECGDIEFLFENKIPPELIEVSTPNGWRKITSLRRI